MTLQSILRRLESEGLFLYVEDKSLRFQSASGMPTSGQLKVLDRLKDRIWAHLTGFSKLKIGDQVGTPFGLGTVKAINLQDKKAWVWCEKYTEATILNLSEIQQKRSPKEEIQFRKQQFNLKLKRLKFIEERVEQNLGIFEEYESEWSALMEYLNLNYIELGANGFDLDSGYFHTKDESTQNSDSFLYTKIGGSCGSKN